MTRSTGVWLDCHICTPLPGGKPRGHAAEWALHRKGRIKHVVANGLSPADVSAMNAEWHAFLIRVGLFDLATSDTSRSAEG